MSLEIEPSVPHEKAPLFGTGLDFSDEETEEKMKMEEADETEDLDDIWEIFEEDEL